MPSLGRVGYFSGQTFHLTRMSEDEPLPTIHRLPHEKNRIPVLRTLDALAAIADPLGGGHAAAIDRACGRSRRARRRRRLFPRASLRAPACFALSFARRRRCK